MRNTCPEIVGVEGREDITSAPQRLKMYAAAGSPEFAPGSWIRLADTPANGYQAVASGEANASHVIDSIEDAAGKRLPFQHVAAGSLTQYYVWAKPIGNLVFRITEDADTTPITDANSGALAATYCDVVVTAMADISTQDRQFGNPTPNIKLDSNTVNATQTGLLVQLLGLDTQVDQPAYSATTLASPRVFRCKVASAAAQANQ